MGTPTERKLAPSSAENSTGPPLLRPITAAGFVPMTSGPAGTSRTSSQVRPALCETESWPSPSATNVRGAGPAKATRQHLTRAPSAHVVPPSVLTSSELNDPVAAIAVSTPAELESTLALLANDGAASFSHASPVRRQRTSEWPLPASRLP